MDLKVFKAVWGMQGTWETRLRQIAEAGYTGVETPLPAPEDESQFRENSGESGPADSLRPFVSYFSHRIIRLYLV